MPRTSRTSLVSALALALLAAVAVPPARGTAGMQTPSSGGPRLGIAGDHFTLDGKDVFLLCVSYFAALGVDAKTWAVDLDRMQRCGVSGLRVWATWDAYGNDVSAVDAGGHAREPALGKLKALLQACGRRGMVLDVTLTRGGGAVPPLQTPEALQRAVETLVTELKPYGNWYLDLANERNVGDSRFVSFDELSRLRDAARRLDAHRLLTASQGGDISRDELREYLMTARVDFVCPHRPRDPGSPGQTAAKTREYLAWMREIGRVVPVHYQEPFRRGYGAWQPRAEDFEADLKGAREGGAAGWCFHNGSNRTVKDERPRRSFDLRDGPLFEQLDSEERRFVQALSEHPGPGNK